MQSLLTFGGNDAIAVMKGHLIRNLLRAPGMATKQHTPPAFGLGERFVYLYKGATDIRAKNAR